jgi:hypothetical protein
VVGTAACRARCATDGGFFFGAERRGIVELTRCFAEERLLSQSKKMIPNAVSLTVATSQTLQKMRKNRIGWRIEELMAVAEENSVEWRRPGRGGSHVIFSAPGVREIVSIPAKRPIKPVYIKQFLALIDAAGGIGTK